MIENEMMFLGLLVDGPKHGYEIKRIIDEELFPCVGLKVKSIYYPLKRMEELKLITKNIGREGKRPEKFIYCITALGRKMFDQMLAKSFLDIERPYFTIDLSLYFLPFVDRQIAQQRLRGRVLFLRRIHRDLEKMIVRKKATLTRHLKIILEHDLDLVDAEIKSLTRLIKSVV